MRIETTGKHLLSPISFLPRRYLGGFVGHLDSILKNVDGELGARVTRHPEPEEGEERPK